VAVKAGTRYSAADYNRLMRLTREQLMNTTLFVDVILRKDMLGEDEADIEVEVKERIYFFPLPYFKVIDRNWNVWIKDYGASLDRTNYGVKLLHNNFSGRNDKMNIWVIGGYTQQLEFKYQLPYVDKKLEKGFNVGMSYMRNREINYATDSNRQQFSKLSDFGRNYFKAEGAFTYRKGSNKRFFLRAIYGHESIDSAFYLLNPNLLGGKTKANYLDINAIYQYYNVDYIPFPLRGWYLDVYATKRFSGTLGMYQMGGKILGTWKFLPKTYINFQASMVFTTPHQQAFYNTRLMGYGSLYMQGLEYYVMDGTFGVMGRTTIRRELFTLTFKGPDSWKSHSRIPFRFFMKTFGNLGYAYAEDPGATNYMNNRLLRTAGFGLEIATIYDFVFKLEYSFNQFGESGFFIHTASDF
jgi:hypothetical protein